MAVGNGAKVEKQTREDWLDEVRVKADAARQKPSVVLAVPHTPVRDLTVAWRKPSTDEMLVKNADEVLEISTTVPAVPGRHASGQRMLLRKTFCADVPDALEFGEVGQGVEVLRKAGAFTPFHIQQIEEALAHPPETIKTRMDAVAEIHAWQSQIRPARAQHSFIKEWVKPVASAVKRIIPFIK